MVFLGRQEDLRAGEAVSPEQRYNYQRRHERIEDSPHLAIMIHDFQIGIADYFDTVLVFAPLVAKRLFQRSTRSARKVFQRLASPSFSNSKNTLPG